MNRRGFLGFSLAATALAALPVALSEPSLALADIKRAVGLALRPFEGDFYVVLHPRQARDLADMAAREWWKSEWRRQRLARRGVHEPVVEYQPLFGQMDGVRFVGSV